ncbi:class I SAM-dependent DNA methyltransferase [Actinomycetospora straminea]|uniref:Class I SAM-dependent methyltransferase n=1 Tax=Actinomycetospora straminea TaxID=663607 RepID=A0ABP9E6R3_9PSEU|nr:class I SAM-dependent methyltransferase [Actinomycetospora straminea]MDD7936056.1 class I SAM-dependent methyltransferase [Actinomycetospora straminea]
MTDQPSTPTGGNPHMERAYTLRGPDDAREFYDEWAETYDDELADASQDYVAPGLAADTVVRVAGVGVTVLDAGCGTGLVGAELAAREVGTVDGVDVSPGMLERARATGAYRSLEPADLTRPLRTPADSYDVVVCVGTLTHGHVGPEALAEFVRVTRPGGHVVATVLDDVWESGGYRAEVDDLVSAGRADLVSADVTPYRAGVGVEARMLVLAVR